MTWKPRDDAHWLACADLQLRGGSILLNSVPYEIHKHPNQVIAKKNYLLAASANSG